jgi:hypothetical protein
MAQGRRGGASREIGEGWPVLLGENFREKRTWVRERDKGDGNLRDFHGRGG